ncbi:hypothetical protein BCO26_2297 [Heyndrickxia coagulans 2-6]|nr:hypothetical protein BCO26_2297 [Heyndrickxia coagulans 2-6]
MSSSTLINERRDTTAYSEKADTPRWCFTSSPFAWSRMPPPGKVPAVLDAAPVSHNAGRPSLHGRHSPQLGTNTHTTWSPGARSVTPSPVLTTSPAASCPSAIGKGRGLLPFTTDKSEWHKLVAFILISTSPCCGSSSSNVSILIGLLAAYGTAAPDSRSTAALIFTPSHLLEISFCSTLETMFPVLFFYVDKPGTYEDILISKRI